MSINYCGWWGWQYDLELEKHCKSLNHWIRKGTLHFLSFIFSSFLPSPLYFLFLFPISIFFHQKWKKRKQTKKPFYIGGSIFFFLSDLNQEQEKNIQVAFCSISGYNTVGVDGGWTDERKDQSHFGSELHQLRTEWPGDSFHSHITFPEKKESMWGLNKYAYFKIIDIDHFLYSNCSLPTSLWEQKEVFHSYAISSESFYSLVFAVALLFSHCWGKTFQFPLPKISIGIFFGSVNLWSVIGEKIL